MDVPPSSHFIYIPVLLVLGIVLGFVMGSRATRDQIRMDQQKAEERERKKAARRAAASEASGDDAAK